MDSLTNWGTTLFNTYPIISTALVLLVVIVTLWKPKIMGKLLVILLIIGAVYMVFTLMQDTLMTGAQKKDEMSSKSQEILQ